MTEPDRWVLVQVDQTFHKIFATWNSDMRWRINSGNKSVKLHEEGFIVNGFSGSEYLCREEDYGFAHKYGEDIIGALCKTTSGIQVVDLEEAIATLIKLIKQ